MDCSAPGLPVLDDLPEFAQTYAHWVGDAIQISHPLSSSSQPAFNLSQHQGLFQWTPPIRWPKYWSITISPYNEYSRLISFRIDWLGVLTVQGTLKSHLQYHSLKASIFQHSAFFIVQLSHLYVTTDVEKHTSLLAMSLLFNMLPSFVMAFLPKSRCLLILWLQSLSAVILEPKNIKPDTVSIFSPSIFLGWQQLGTKKGVTKT